LEVGFFGCSFLAVLTAFSTFLTVAAFFLGAAFGFLTVALATGFAFFLAGALSL